MASLRVVVLLFLFGVVTCLPLNSAAFKRKASPLRLRQLSEDSSFQSVVVDILDRILDGQWEQEQQIAALSDKLNDLERRIVGDEATLTAEEHIVGQFLEGPSSFDGSGSGSFYSGYDASGSPYNGTEEGQEISGESNEKESEEESQDKRQESDDSDDSDESDGSDQSDESESEEASGKKRQESGDYDDDDESDDSDESDGSDQSDESESEEASGKKRQESGDDDDDDESDDDDDSDESNDSDESDGSDQSDESESEEASGKKRQESGDDNDDEESEYDGVSGYDNESDEDYSGQEEDSSSEEYGESGSGTDGYYKKNLAKLKTLLARKLTEKLRAMKRTHK